MSYRVRDENGRRVSREVKSKACARCGITSRQVTRPMRRWEEYRCSSDQACERRQREAALTRLAKGK